MYKCFVSLLLLSFYTGFAQYCEPNQNCSFDDVVDELTFGNLSNLNSGCSTNGYVYYDNMSQQYTIGDTYNFTIAPGSYPQGFAIWIDYNQNESFEASEVEYLSSQATNSQVSGSITISLTALSGPTRLRVKSIYNTTMAATDACTESTYGETEDYLIELIPSGPPVADFEVSTTSTCNGVVSFTNSAISASSYLWYFGDGNTSTEENPTHTYSADGDYTVSFVATNSSGSDSVAMVDLINVDFSNAPVATSCVSNTSSYCCGYGITSFSFSTINSSSQDGTVGYEDYTCTYLANVYQGSSYSIAIGNGNGVSQNYAVYIDFNNNGEFDLPEERVFTQSATVNAAGNVVIPSDAVLNTPIRLRVMGEYDFNLVNNPCADVQYGQSEDYTIKVLANENPPVAQFNVDPTFSCDGEFVFENTSLNSPDTYHWDFGDGNEASSESPNHTYAATGTYEVELIVTNAFGEDTLKQEVTVDLDGDVIAASCNPNTLGYCCEYGITRVELEDILNTTSDGVDGYQDYSCSYFDTLVHGSDYSISINTGGTNPHDIRVWVDMNNDGTFDPVTELAYQANNVTSPTGTLTLPLSTTAVYDQKLRMRVSADFTGAGLTPCTSPFYGQVEDYGIIITEPVLPPSADFVGTPVESCNGIIEFTDLSNDNPEEWLWDFGDGNSSTEQSPTHTYMANGTYTVSLTATNGNGTDTETKVNYISVALSGLCDTLFMNDNRNDTVYSCQGVIVDNGGVNGNYYNNTESIITIAPQNADYITFNINYYEFEWDVDSLYFFDGGSINAPLLATYSTNGFQEPAFSSSTGEVTVMFVSNNAFNAAGFEIEYSCAVGVKEEVANPSKVYPNPTNGLVHIDFSKGFKSNVQVLVIDALGRVVIEKNVNPVGQEQFDLSHLNVGTYHVKLISDNQQEIFPLIITK